MMTARAFTKGIARRFLPCLRLLVGPVAGLALSEEYRLVFVLRNMEGLNTEETAQCLNLTQENVTVRLHRHAMLRKQLSKVLGESASRCFEFHATRCDRVVKNVFATLGLHR